MLNEGSTLLEGPVNCGNETDTRLGLSSISIPVTTFFNTGKLRVAMPVRENLRLRPTVSSKGILKLVNAGQRYIVKAASTDLRLLKSTDCNTGLLFIVIVQYLLA